MLNDIFSVQNSEGGVHFLLNQLASKGIDAYEMIRQNVMRSRVIGTDETGVKINGKKYWFWTWQNERATYIAASANRGTTTINETTNYVYAGTFHGVFISTNNGTSWTKVNNGLPKYPYVLSIAISGSNIFVGTEVGVFLSTI